MPATLIAPKPSTSTPAPSTGIQRRRHFRVPVRLTTDLGVRVWRIEPGMPIGYKPMPSSEIKVHVLEVSQGGLTIKLMGKSPKSPDVSPTDRLRIEILGEGEPILLEGRVRGTLTSAAQDGMARTGIRFIDRQPERDAEARMVKLVGRLEREALRNRK